jgi:hypothetical protein
MEHAASPQHDFQPARGTVIAGPPIRDHPHRALARGFATPHPSSRSFCYADGSPAFWVIDTAWAMPFRATVEDVAVYAADRQAKGFNAVMLMTVQPDMHARGPVGRNIDEGFEVGFHDLSRGRLTRSTSTTSSTSTRSSNLDQLRHHARPAARVPRFRLKDLCAGPVVPAADYAATAGISWRVMDGR